MAKNGKKKIISAAFGLFLQNGYNGVSLKNMMDVSNLSKGAIYHHFKSKHSIYLAVIEEYFFKVLQSVSTEDDHLDFISRIKKRYKLIAKNIGLIEQLSTKGNSYPIRSFFIFQLESEKDDTVRKKVTKAIQNYREEIISIVQFAIDKSEITAGLSARVIAVQIICLVEGIVIHNSLLEKNAEEFLLQQYEEILTPYLLLITQQVKTT